MLMEELKDLATFAAQHRIRGRSYKRNSMLKPLGIMLDALDRCPDPTNKNELGLVIAGSKGLINEHIQRVAKKVPQGAVYAYVDIFFDNVLEKAHHGNANALLEHERLLRSAYLVYMREELARIFVNRGKAQSTQDALNIIEREAEQDHDDEDENNINK